MKKNPDSGLDKLNFMDTVEKTQFISSLKDKAEVSSPFLVKFSAVATGKTGKPYMNLVLMDRTGEMEARIWDGVEIYSGQAVKDVFVWVEGKCQTFQNRLQIIVSDLQILREEQTTISDYLEKSALNPEDLYSTILKFISTMKDPDFRTLAESIFIDDEDIVSRLKTAPAAKTIHHAYAGGLLEHIVSIVKFLDFAASHYGPQINRDLLILGGLLHDIGKLWELTYERVIDYSSEGRLIGHLVMGAEVINKKIAELETKGEKIKKPFPMEKALLLKHMILSHHGQLEFGSPKRPKCLEAVILNSIDDLDSKICAIGEFIKSDQTYGEWTGYNRQMDRFFYKSNQEHE